MVQVQQRTLSTFKQYVLSSFQGVVNDPLYRSYVRPETLRPVFALGIYVFKGYRFAAVYRGDNGVVVLDNVVQPGKQ